MSKLLSQIRYFLRGNAVKVEKTLAAVLCQFLLLLFQINNARLVLRSFFIVLCSSNMVILQRGLTKSLFLIFGFCRLFDLRRH